MSVQVRGRPPSQGDGENGDDDCDDDGGANTIATGANPFSIAVTTNETGTATVTFTYGQGSTTFTDAQLPTYFTDAPTSTVVTGAAPSVSMPFGVLTVGTVYWLQATGCGITTAQLQFKRTQ